MTVDFILHGVPNGQDFWGASDDNHYFSTFYVQKNEKEYLSVEARKVSGKSYCYYNYLKYNNVTAADGRAGAYLGITLRFDAYYKDILNVYQIFEIIYNNFLDTILDKNGEGIKFKVAKFEAAERELNEIKKKVVSLIQLSATAKDFTALNDSFFNNEDKTIQAFLLDCTPENVLQALKKYGKVDISKYYPSTNEAKKMRSIEERYASTISQKDKDLSEKNLNINKLTDECQGLKKDLSAEKEEVVRLGNLVAEKETIIKGNEASLKQVEELKSNVAKLKNNIEAKDKEISKLNIELRRCKDNRELSDMVEQIKSPLMTLANYAGRQSCKFPDNSCPDSSEDPSSDNKIHEKNLHENLSLCEKPVFQIVKMFILCLTLCVSLFCAYQLCFTDSNDEAFQNMEYIKEENIPIESDIIKTDSIEQKNDTINQQVENTENE